MTREQLQEYIQTRISTRAALKYPDRADQLYYTVGFLVAQLADAMYNDSRVAYKFKDTVNKLK
jgi:hypothetical protein